MSDLHLTDGSSGETIKPGAFAKFTGVFWNDISDVNFLFSVGKFHVTTQQFLAMVIIILLTVYNYRDVKTGALLQNIFTITSLYRFNNKL